MKWKLTSDQILVTGISLLLLSIAFIIILSVSQSRKVKETNNMVAHSQEIINGTEKLYALVLKNETSLKKYAITADKNQLKIIERTNQDMADRLRRLKSLSGKMPVQKARIDSLDYIINKRIAFSTRVLSVREAKGAEAAKAMMGTSEGTSYTDKIHLMADEIMVSEYYNLKPLEERDEKMLARHISTFTGVIVVILLLLIFFIERVRTELSEKRKTAVALEKLNREMEQRVSERTIELAKSKNILSETFERITDAFVALDKNWCYTYMNKKAGEIFDLDPKGMIGKHIWTEFPEGIGQPFYKAYHKAMEEQRYIYLEEYYPPYDRWFDNHIYPSPDGLSIFFRDITEKKKAEIKIRESEGKYRMLIEQASDGIFIADENGKYIEVNNSGCVMTGYSADEICALYIKDLVVMDQHALPFRMEELMEGKTVIQVRKMKRKDGTAVPVEISARLLPNGKMLGMVRDLTERINAEQKLQREKDLSDKIINSLPGLFYLADTTPKLLRWNKAFEKFSGYSVEDLGKMKPITLFDPEDRPMVVQSLQKTYQEGFADVEARLLTKSGQKFPFFFTGVSIEYEGKPAMLGTGINIAERKKAEEEIKKSNERYGGLLNNLDAGVVVHAPDTSIINSNPKASELLGLGEDQMKGKKAMDPNWKFLDENNVPLSIGKYPVNQILISKQPIKNLIAGVNRPSTNDVVWLIVNGFPVFNNTGEIAEIVISFIDITGLKKAEQEKEKIHRENEALINSTSDLLWSVSDDYKLISANSAFLKGLVDNGGYLIKTRDNILPPEYFSEEFLQYWKGFYNRGLSGETVLDEVFTPQAQTSDLLWFEIKIDPIRIDNKITGVACSMRNITGRKKAEEEIIKSNERFELIGQATQDGLWEWNLETEQVWGNEIHQQLYGLTLADPVPDYDKWKQRIHPEDREQTIKSFEEALASTRDSYFSEYRFNKENAGWINVYGRTYIERNKEGKPVRLIGSMIDNTARKKAEEAIKLSEEKYRTLVEQASDAIFIADSEGRFVTVNTSACRLSQHSEEELLRMSVYDFAITEDLQKNSFHFEMLKQGKTVVTERVMKRKDHSTLLIEVNAKLLTDGRLLAFVRDISDRKKAEQALKESENHLRTILQTEPECIKLLTINGELEDMNPAGLAMLEADNIEQVKGKTILNIINKPYRKAFQNLTENVFKGKSGTLEFEITGLKGTARWLSTNAVPMKDAEGKILSLLAVTRDVTDRKKAEEEIKKTTEELRQLTAHLQKIREEERKRIGREIHDELGQQLTAIKMDVAWIDKKTPPGTTVLKDKLKNIITLLDGSNKSIRRILSELRPGILDDYGLLEALEWINRQFTNNTGIPVEFTTVETGIKLPDEVSTCIFRIYQEAFTNITRYAGAKKVVTSLNINDNTIEVIITDDGIGFDPSLIRHRKSFGILGMKERILSLEGNFELDTSPGKGTKITIRVPYPESKKS